jgi:hypothetical protein
MLFSLVWHIARLQSTIAEQMTWLVETRHEVAFQEQRWLGVGVGGGNSQHGGFVAVNWARLRPKLPDCKSYIFNVGTAGELYGRFPFLGTCHYSGSGGRALFRPFPAPNLRTEEGPSS